MSSSARVRARIAATGAMPFPDILPDMPRQELKIPLLAAAGKGIQQKQDAAGEAEPTDGQQRKPYPLKGRKRSPGLGSEKP